MMENENLTNVSAQENGGLDNAVYIEALKEMKENYVPRSTLEKKDAEIAKLVSALKNNTPLDIPEEKPADVNKLRKKLFKNDADLSNLDYVDTALQLRKALIDSGERDPFLPTGTHVSDSADMYEKAQAVADLLQECVDFADGDSGVFTARYQSMVQDSTLPGRGKRK